MKRYDYPGPGQDEPETSTNYPFFDEVATYKSLPSTSKQAHKLISDRMIQGNFLVIAQKQTAGVGRQGNRWYSPEGGLWMTAALYHLSVESNLTLFLGVCIHKTLCEIVPAIDGKLTLKWPNDLYIGNRKCCGILTENLPFFKYHLAGIGINTNVTEFPDDLRDTSVSLHELNGDTVDHGRVIEEIFTRFAMDLPQFIQRKFPLVRDYYMKHAYLTGKRVTIATEWAEISGVVTGVNKEGGLVLRMADGGLQPIFSGSITSAVDPE